MADPQGQAAGVPGGGFGPDLIQRQPQPRREASAAGDHVGGLHPVGQVHDGQVPGAVAVDLLRKRDGVGVLGDRGVDPGQLHRQQRPADQLGGQLAVGLALRHAVGDGLVGRAARPRRGGHRGGQDRQPPQRQPRHDGQHDRPRGQYCRAGQQDRPPPARLALAAGVQRQPLRGVPVVGGGLPQVPVALFRRRPPDQPRHDAHRAGHRVQQRLGRVLRRADGVEAHVIAGLLHRPPQRGGHSGAGGQPRRDDRRPDLAAPGAGRARLVGRVHRRAGHDLADQNRFAVRIVVIAGGVIAAVRPVIGSRGQRPGRFAVTCVPPVRGGSGVPGGVQEQYVGVAVIIACIQTSRHQRGALAAVSVG